MIPLFDVIIYGFLTADIILLILLSNKEKRLFSTTWLKFIVYIIALTSGLTVFYGSFIEPRMIDYKKEIIVIDDNGADEAIHAVFFSDTHVGPYKDDSYIAGAVDLIIAANPDIVFIAGDFVTNQAEQAHYLSPLAKITSTYPVYAVLGNHDYDLGFSGDDINYDQANEIENILTDLGVNILRNEGVLYKNVWIAGIEDIWTNNGSITKSLENRGNNSKATILLSHNPDTISEVTKSQKIDLLLSGHTHGGQIRLPFIGPIGKIPTNLGQKFDKGLFQFESTQLFITSGLGETGPRSRLFNKPEIIDLTILY